MFYATHDNDGEKIFENAEIAKFETREEMETYLASPYTPDSKTCASYLEPDEYLTFETMSFGDCWLKVYERPRVGSTMISPFNYNDVFIDEPGSHPGGKCFWITPRREIYVAVVNVVDSENRWDNTED